MHINKQSKIPDCLIPPNTFLHLLALVIKLDFPSKIEPAGDLVPWKNKWILSQKIESNWKDLIFFQL